MSRPHDLVFECALDAPPEKVWRALTIPEYLARWLDPEPGLDLALINTEKNRSAIYHCREVGDTGDIHDSVFTFELQPTGNGGTWLRLTHTPLVLPAAANSNGPIMRAA